LNGLENPDVASFVWFVRLKQFFRYSSLILALSVCASLCMWMAFYICLVTENSVGMKTKSFITYIGSWFKNEK
jgi:hypothetical protein